MDAFVVIERWGPAHVLAGPTPWTHAHKDAPPICAVSAAGVRVPAALCTARDNFGESVVERTELHLTPPDSPIVEGARLARAFHVGDRQIGDRHSGRTGLVELLPGARLSDVLLALDSRKGVLPVVAALLVARDVAGVIAALDGQPRFTGNDVVIGWDGVSRVEQQLSSIWVAKDSLFEWLTPEHVRGLPIVRESSAHAVGQVLYALLLGRNPAKRANTFLTLEAARNGDRPALARRDVPDVVAALLERALHPQPEARWPLPALAEYLDEAVRALADPAQVASMWRALLEEAMPDVRRAQLDWLEELQVARLT